MYLYDQITTKGEDGVSAIDFRDALQSIGDVKEINLHINSPGGNVFEGVAIYNMFQQNKAKINVYIDALAASIASVIAMSGDAIFMPENSMLMIHNPFEGVVGNANELRKEADALDKITQLSVSAYVNKANGKIDQAKVQKLMDNESWLSAEEAVNYGLADQILPANQAVAVLDGNAMKHFKHIPKQLATEENKPKKQEPVASNNPEEHEEMDFETIAEQANLRAQKISHELQELKGKLYR
ncbi:atp-dependent clp protease proteolytic subunit [Lactobacillus hominis DSM 23910 = CRBIP 24.179]|nr:atp-dependent clp protease proteolytic subunit [Lactobacillus hominis DSM 23910 = CRBIP 24.179]